MFGLDCKKVCSDFRPALYRHFGGNFKSWMDHLEETGLSRFDGHHAVRVQQALEKVVADSKAQRRLLMGRHGTRSRRQLQHLPADHPLRI